MPASKRLKDIEKALRSARRIVVPYSIVATKYAATVANILDQLHESKAADAKSKQADDFKWAFDYIQPADPSTRNEVDFIDQLQKEARVFLVCMGWKWKGAVELEQSNFPVQVRNRFEERARLVCSQIVAVEPVVEAPQVISRDTKNIDESVTRMLQLLKSLQRCHLNEEQIGMVNIAKTAISTIKVLQK